MGNREERRDGMNDVLKTLGELTTALGFIQDNQKEMKQDMKDMYDKVGWTHNQLKGNGKTTLQGFREADKAHEDELKEVRKEMQNGFAKVIDKIDTMKKDTDKAISDNKTQMNKNKNNIFRIMFGITFVLLCIGGVIIWASKILSLLKELRGIDITVLKGLM